MLLFRLPRAPCDAGGIELYTPMLSDANRNEPEEARQPSQTDQKSSGAQPPTPTRTPVSAPTIPEPRATNADTTDDDYLYRLLREDDEAPTLAPPPGARGGITPIPATSPATTPHGRVIHQEISPTLERREVLQGARLGEKYLRVKQPQKGFFRKQADDELEATVPAPEPRTGAERLLRRGRVALFGEPLTTAQQIHERLTKVKALAVLSSDAISSAAAATRPGQSPRFARATIYEPPPCG